MKQAGMFDCWLFLLLLLLLLLLRILEKWREPIFRVLLTIGSKEKQKSHTILFIFTFTKLGYLGNLLWHTACEEQFSGDFSLPSSPVFAQWMARWMAKALEGLLFDWLRANRHLYTRDLHIHGGKFCVHVVYDMTLTAGQRPWCFWSSGLNKQGRRWTSMAIWDGKTHAIGGTTRRAVAATNNKRIHYM